MRQADAHIRFCIALCVFVVLVTLPLHFSDIEELSQPRFGTGHLSHHKILSYSYNPRIQRLHLSYHNGFKLPRTLTYTCRIDIRDANNTPIASGTSHYTLHAVAKPQSQYNSDPIPDTTSNIRTCSLQIPLPTRSKRTQKQTGTQKQKTPAPTATTTAASTTLTGYHITLHIHNAEHQHICTVSGTIASNDTFLHAVTYTDAHTKD